ncbi:MAG: tail fiber protein [Rhizomicrobium sp.]
MSEPYVGQIAIFAFNFAPRNWSFCNGALVPIAQNEALFTILGTTYGGDGRNTFGLPNIQDSTVMNIGQGPGLSNYVLGQHSGSAEVTLTQNQIPLHSHAVNGQNAAQPTAFELVPQTSYWVGSREGGAKTDFQFTPNPAAGQTFAPSVISVTGGSLPHNNEQPYLGMNYCIALYGIFPSRN